MINPKLFSVLRVAYEAGLNIEPSLVVDMIIIRGRDDRWTIVPSTTDHELALMQNEFDNIVSEKKRNELVLRKRDAFLSSLTKEEITRLTYLGYPN